MRLNLKQLDAFRAIMMAGSTSEAALLLNISQPAVSRSLQNLEASVQQQLFIRRNGRLHPTREAERLFDELDDLYSRFDHVANVMKNLRPAGDGHLQVLASTPMAQSFLPRAFASFRENWPNVNISLRVVVKRETVRWLESQQFDLALLTSPVDYPAAFVERIVAVEAVCILPAGHRLARQPVIDAGDLAEESFISIVPDTTLRLRVDAAFKSQGVERRYMQLETQSGASICQMVSAGLGVSVIDPFNADAFRWMGIEVRPFRPRVRFDYGLMFPMHRQPRPLVEDFAALLREHAAQFIAEHRQLWDGWSAQAHAVTEKAAENPARAEHDRPFRE